MRSEGGETVYRADNATPAQIDALAAELQARGCQLLLAMKQLAE